MAVPRTVSNGAARLMRLLSQNTSPPVAGDLCPTWMYIRDKGFIRDFYVRRFVVVFNVFYDVFYIRGFPTTTFGRIRFVGDRLTRRIDPRIPDTPKS